MPEYIYKAKTRAGKDVSGQMTANTVKEVLDRLNAQKLFPISVEDAHKNDVDLSKLFKSKGQHVATIWMGLTALALLLLWLMPKSWGFIPYCIGLGLVGFILYGPQTLAGVVAAGQATKKAASAAVGLVGIVSYCANLFTGIGIGALSDHFGDVFWDYLFLILAVVSLIGGFFFALTWNAKDGYERAREIN